MSDVASQSIADAKADHEAITSSVGNHAVLDDASAASTAVANDDGLATISGRTAEAPPEPGQSAGITSLENPDAAPSASASVVDDELEEEPITTTVASTAGVAKSSKAKKKKKKGKK
jgi:hypothetical protein